VYVSNFQTYFIWRKRIVWVPFGSWDSGKLHSAQVSFTHGCVCILSDLLTISSFFLSVLGFELRPYTLSHSASPFLVKVFFEIGSLELFAQVALNRDPPELCL
jgi:hypothetical protein